MGFLAMTKRYNSEFTFSQITNNQRPNKHLLSEALVKDNLTLTQQIAPSIQIGCLHNSVDQHWR